MGRDLRVVLVAAVLLAIGLFGVAAGAQGKAPPTNRGATQGRADPKMVERGAYLARIAGCGDCHTPMKMDPALGVLAPDMSRAFSGHPQGGAKPGGKLGEKDVGLIGPTFTSFQLPFGTVYAANLTPHETGIGNWTEQQFVQAMRTGMHLGDPKARPILPPMPWQNLMGATDQDLKAIFAYFKSLPPIANAVPQPEVQPAVYEQLTRAYAKMREQAPTGMDANMKKRAMEPQQKKQGPPKPR